ncbi:MAG TPA: NAD(P)/FAD-dependent oxidoreductase [Methanotrichaceae archaeon]|nr:NAD(P)/FAD-dependent oxidoreductase [Methanotrichaceae archaeon]
MKCDVLVVGASPAGIMAAVKAARLGSEVILMDKNLGRLDHAANTLFEGMASRAGLQVEDCYLQHELDGMRILSPSGHGVTIPASGFFIDRKKFDDYHMAIAEAAGITVMLGEVKDARLSGGKRSVSTDQGEIEAKVVIDASGVQAQPTLASKVGLSPMLHPQDIAWAMEAEIEHPGLGEEKFFQYWIGSMAPGWKATFSPAGGDRATLGVFVRGHGQNVHSFFRDFLKIFKKYKSSAYRNIDDLKILSVKRGGDPIAVLPGEIVSESFMVTGGAAGQSGLAYGMRAGQICGEVAAQAVKAGDTSGEFLGKYEKNWNSEFDWEYRMGRAALQTLQNLKDAEVDRLVAGLSGRSLISEGSFYQKALYAGMKVALARPRTVTELIWNLARD